MRGVKRMLIVASTTFLGWGCARPSSPPAAPDVYRFNPKTGEMINVSQAHRERLEADKTLARLKTEFRSETAEQLIGRFNAPDGINSGDYPRGTRYYIVLEGNKMVEAELRRRGDEAKSALERHRNDQTIVFTGGCGLFISVGAVCADVLAEDDPILYHLPVTRSGN